MAECSAECTRLLAVAKAQGEQEMAEAGEMAVKMTISAKLEEAKIQDLIIEAKSKLAKIESEILEKSKKLIG